MKEDHDGRQVAAAAAAALVTRPKKRAAAARLDALGRFQAEALREFGSEMDTNTGNKDINWIPLIETLAELRDEAVRGCGSTRLGIDAGLGGSAPRVAKIAHDYFGLIWNLQEAAAWLAFPKSVRKAMAPSVVLTPDLVLVQKQVEVLGPPLTAETLGRHEEAERERKACVKLHNKGILDAMTTLGLVPTSGLVRLDNWGLHEGRVVGIDLGEKWQPLESAWVYLLKRLRRGPVWLDQPERDRMYRALSAGPRLPSCSVSLRSLLERAGLTFNDADECPYHDLDGSQIGSCQHTYCAMSASAVEIQCSMAHTEPTSGGGRFATVGHVPLSVEEEMLDEAGILDAARAARKAAA